MKNIQFKFDFDDILIIPSTKTHISSRYKDITLPQNLPLFTAPMDTVVDLSNIDYYSAKSCFKLVFIIHKFSISVLVFQNSTSNDFIIFLTVSI